MDDGQRYRDQSSQPVRAVLLKRRRDMSRDSAGRRSSNAARRAVRPAPRQSFTRRNLTPQFVTRLVRRRFR